MATKCASRGCFGVGVTAAGLCEDCWEQSPAYLQRRCMDDYSATPRLLSPRKVPHAVLSYELETEPREGANYREALAVAVHGCACRDGSVSGPEYKISGTCCGTHSVGYKLVSVAERARAVGLRVNRKTGLHVHMDRRETSCARLRELAIWLVRSQDQFARACPASRWGSHYVQAVSSPTTVIEYLREGVHWGSVGLDQHYRWFNISRRHTTVEFRWHPGTMSEWKLRGYHDYMTHLAHWFRAEDQREFPESILDVCPRDSLGHEYMSARISSGGSLRPGRRSQETDGE
jgi:hypothetical protein